MAITTSGGATASCLTENDDGTITVRLHPRSKVAREVVLQEPTAREYATLRTLIVSLDDEINQKFPPLDAPQQSLGATDPNSVEGLKILTDYQRDVTEWVKQRRDFIRDIDTAPYAHALMTIIETLADVKVSFDDLTAEAFNPLVCGALLEAWERPLDGQGFPVATPAVTEPEVAAPEPAPLPNVEAPASPEPAPSSPPGTEPSTQSHPPSLTP